MNTTTILRLDDGEELHPACSGRAYHVYYHWRDGKGTSMEFDTIEDAIGEARRMKALGFGNGRQVDCNICIKQIQFREWIYK